MGPPARPTSGGAAPARGASGLRGPGGRGGAAGGGMTTTAPSPFGALLRRHRLDAGLTQEALAERAGISARAVSDLERHGARAPRGDTLALLAAALHLPPEHEAQLRVA